MQQQAQLSKRLAAAGRPTGARPDSSPAPVRPTRREASRRVDARSQWRVARCGSCSEAAPKPNTISQSHTGATPVTGSLPETSALSRKCHVFTPHCHGQQPSSNLLWRAWLHRATNPRPQWSSSSRARSTMPSQMALALSPAAPSWPSCARQPSALRRESGRRV